MSELLAVAANRQALSVNKLLVLTSPFLEDYQEFEREEGNMHQLQHGTFSSTEGIRQTANDPNYKEFIC